VVVQTKEQPLWDIVARYTTLQFKFFFASSLSSNRSKFPCHKITTRTETTAKTLLSHTCFAVQEI
jgi:hypothetical protein